MQSIIGIFRCAISVPTSAFRIDPDMELVAELPEYDFIDSSSSQLCVVQVR
jgi:hypothetical protein